jgi:NhaP-type Na+/H+ or K+/H+ antiporter
MPAENRSRSKFAAVLRTILWALMIAFVVGFVIGTLIRRQLEQPVRYIGSRAQIEAIAASVLPADPRHIGDPEPCVFMPGHHEEEV